VVLRDRDDAVLFETGGARGMKGMKILGGGVLVVLALMMIGVSASQAETLEWGKCVEVEDNGKYTDAGCTEKATKHHGGLFDGGYEWTSLEVVKDLTQMVVVGDVSFETAAGISIQCTGVGGESAEYALNEKALTTPLWIFTGCHGAGGEEECAAIEISNEYAWYGIPAEEGLPMPGWNGKLGFVSGAGTSNPVVGVEYKVLNHERLFEPVKCEGALGTVWIGGSRIGGDSFISTIEPVNTMTKQFTQVYGESAPGVSSVTNFEGKRTVHLEAFLGDHWEPVAILATFHDEVEYGEEELEIKANK
jgi:hypothetical protein